MALKPYGSFPRYNQSEPLTPFIYLQFRGHESFSFTFPNQSNRVYVENATFSVLDDNGYSTATITLADPDFINLENVFLKALFLANTLTIGEGNWFCAAQWGWNSYGAKEVNAASMVSGKHYYMLKNLSYDLDDVELRVTVELMDIGHSAFGTTDANSPQVVVGKLNAVDKSITTQQQGTSESTGSDSLTAKQIEEQAAAELRGKITAEGAGVVRGAGTGTTVDAEYGGASGQPTDSGTATEATYDNIIFGKTYWEIIQILCKAQGITAVARIAKGDPEAPKDGPQLDATPPNPGKYIIASNKGFKEAIEEVKNLIKPIESSAGKPGRHWDILSGGNVVPGQTKPQMAWGWKMDPPKAHESTGIEDNYRKARTLVYRPHNKEEIGAGWTMINSLKYNWTSRGYLGVGLPPIYGVAADAQGKPKVYTSLDDWKNMNPSKNDILGREHGNPSVKPYSMEEFQQKGIQVKFNFDTRTQTKEEIEYQAGALIVNVWNFFLYELIDINIEMPGDPWLDNTLFLDGEASKVPDYLVDLYHAYFDVIVYKPGVGAQNLQNDILTGKYLCLKGCVHSISEGEYTTSLTLMKSF